MSEGEPRQEPAGETPPGTPPPASGGEAAPPAGAPPPAAAPLASSPAPSSPQPTKAAAAGGSLLPLIVVGVLVLVGLFASGQLGGGAAQADLEALLEEGRQKLTQRGPDEAVQVLKQAHGLAPEDPRTNSALGQVLVQLDRFDEALPLLEKAAEKEPQVATHRAVLGVALIGLRRLPEAEAALGEALRLAPDDPRPLFQLGIAAGMRQDFLAVEKHLRAYLAHPRVQGPDRGMGLNLLAGALDLQGRPEEGTAVLSSLCALLPGDVALRRRVDQRMVGVRGEGFAATLSEACEAAEREGATAADHLRVARLLMRHPRERKDARAALERAVELDRAAPAGQKLGGWPQFALATEELRDDRLEQARLLVEEALQLGPKLTEARFLRVELERRAGQFEQARAQLEQFLDGEQGLQARLELVETWLREGQPEQALAFARGQADGREAAHPAQLVLSAALAGAGQLDEAARVMSAHRDALPAGEARALADSRLGQLHLAAGASEQARLAFDRALEALRQLPPPTPPGVPPPAQPGQRHPPPDLLLWAGVAHLPADKARAEALWGEGAVSGMELVPEALATFACRRLLGRATAEELTQAASVSALEDQNDARFLEGLRRELEGQAAAAKAAYQECLEQSQAHEFPARLAEARQAGLGE